MPPQPRLIMYM
uniref:Uncharacterized protein n=1 Tax=Anguilla anguilla TaxID=7936 RepID=A0A0E9UJT0_ANGAN